MFAYTLKSCPFCGGEAKLSKNDIMIRGVSERCAWVYCRQCGSRSQYYRKAKGGNFVAEAVDAWNRRAGDDQDHQG